MKTIESLAISDLQTYGVWQYTNRDELGDTLVRPVKRVPVTSLTGKVVGTRVRLANGTLIWGLLGNVDTTNARLTEHFLTLSVLHDERWFTLSRYHDFDYDENGPEGLANFLGLSCDEVFPITYDIRGYVNGSPAALAGQIDKEPRERLTRAEIIAMAVP